MNILNKTIAIGKLAVDKISLISSISPQIKISLVVCIILTNIIIINDVIKNENFDKYFKIFVFSGSGHKPIIRKLELHNPKALRKPIKNIFFNHFIIIKNFVKLRK